MIQCLILCSFIAAFLLLWFKTEAWYEYTKKVGLGRLSGAKLYESEKMNDITITYIQFLRKWFGKFFVIRLITCPICISAWWAFLLSMVMWNFLIAAPLMLGGLILYGIVCQLLEI